MVGRSHYMWVHWLMDYQNHRRGKWNKRFKFTWNMISQIGYISKDGFRFDIGCMDNTAIFIHSHLIKLRLIWKQQNHCSIPVTYFNWSLPHPGLAVLNSFRPIISVTSSLPKSLVSRLFIQQHLQQHWQHRNHRRFELLAIWGTGDGWIPITEE